MAGWQLVLCQRENRFTSLLLLLSEQEMWQHNCSKPSFPGRLHQKGCCFLKRAETGNTVFIPCSLQRRVNFAPGKCAALFFPLNARPAVFFLSCTQVERALFRKIASPQQLSTVPISWLISSQVQMAHNIGNKLFLFLKYGS